MQNSSYSPPLLALYTGRLASELGDRIYLVALTIFLAREDPRLITVLYLIGFLAPVVSGLFAGTLIAKIGPRAAAILSDAASASATVAMPFFLHSPILFLWVGIVGLAQPIFGPALTSLVSSVTVEDNRHRVSSIFSTVGAGAQVIGPLVGGALYLVWLPLPFILQTASFIVSAICTSIPKFGDVCRPEATPHRGFAAFRHNLGLGFGYMRKSRPLTLILLTALAINVGGGTIEAYLVLYVTRGLHLGAPYYATMVSFEGLMWVIVGLVNARYLSKRKQSWLFRFSTVALVAGIATLALAVNYAMLLVSICLFSTGMLTISTSMYAVRMNLVPSAHLGQVSSLFSTLQIAAAGLSVLIAGFFLPFVSIRVIIGVAAFVLCLMTPFALRLASLLREKEMQPASALPADTALASVSDTV
ncbi:MAG: MFS transporter [Firmicutes bacterium]|nr:MFS transporter [Bacillota bacterium]